MLKVALVAFGGFVAAVWIVCGYLYFAPVDGWTAASSPEPRAVAERAGNAPPRRDEQAAERDAGLPKPAVTTQAPDPQYSASGGYVLDGDSVVIAPPTSADGPGSPAEQRRRTRLSVDISKIP